MRFKIILFIIYTCFFQLASCSKEPTQDISNSIEGKFIYTYNSGPTYFIKDLASDEIVTCTGPGAPLLSNSKTMIAFCKSNEVLVTNFSGTEVVYKKSVLSAFNLCLWSPDDKYLALYLTQLNQFRILNLSTSKDVLVNLPENIKFNYFIFWSALDNYIYFSAENNKNKENYISKIKADGSDFQSIFKSTNKQKIGKAHDYYKPSDLIYFTLFDSLSHETSIFKIKPNGEDLQTLYAEITYNPEFFISIKISPNGQNIAFYTLGIKFSTYIWDISGHNKRLFWENAINPHWSKRWQRHNGQLPILC
ncbi:MAG: hypothetical protein IPK46_14655 [Saprospiraceae bacterium]|nr:hypothetical protein [Saprospiraceae bacterium]